MPPRNRRTVAREPSAEEGEAQDGRLNSSLRSFFPLEIVKLILAELDGDLPSLASFCLVSFGCLEEASGELYSNAVVRSDRGLISIFCGTKLKPRSRIIPHLSLHQLQSLFIHLPFSNTPAIVPFLVQKSNVSFPPRLSSSPIELNHLRIAPPQLVTPTSFRYAFDALLIFVLPYLSPIHVDLSRWPTQGHGPLDWVRTMRSWSSRFRSVTLRGGDGNQIALFLGAQTTTQFLLRGSPYILSEGAFELMVNVSENHGWRDETCVGVLQRMGVFELAGLRTKFVVAEWIKQGWKEELAKLSEEEQERVELVVVEEAAE